jgi:uncharacterized protein YdbL (DUF1318 family)
MKNNFFKYKNFLQIIILLILSSCITVNVNFPESAVQRAADDFVRELYQKTEETKPSNSSNKKQTKILNFLIEEAFAEELKLSSPKTLEIKKRMSERVSTIIEWKKKGKLGETYDGNLKLHDTKGLSKEAKDKLKKLVEEENEDRNLLYQEIQNLNQLTDHNQSRIRKFFANAFKENSPTGTWIQDEQGNWTQK